MHQEELSQTKKGKPFTAVMRYVLPFVLILTLLSAIFLPSPTITEAATIPSFDINAVAADDSVTIQTYNFPAGETFTVRMGAYGTLGVGGIVVGITDSGSGGSFIATYNIPDALKGSHRIAIRMESGSGYYAYNWFYNNASSGATGGPTSGYTGIPSFTIKNVAMDDTVTVRTNNFPAGQTFTVRMGTYGTLAVGGIVVGTTDSGDGGAFEATYDIPDALKGDNKIAIRMDSSSGYYAYNWFYNNTSSGATGGPTGGYTGVPTFAIKTVAMDEEVTIRTSNFPADHTFTVRMGEYGTLGVGGIKVATTDSGDGGSFEATYTIPDELKGRYRIAIRMESTDGYYAYNWFYNNTSGSTGGPYTPPSGYTGIPTFSIKSVDEDTSVTIKTYNFPADLDFKVRMGAYGTLGVGGTVVATTNSGSGGSFEATYDIPEDLQGSYQIAIRLESTAGYYAYNWFYNHTSGSATGGPYTTPAGYSGIPTFTISSVARNDSVTVKGYNFPPDQTFTVRINNFGTLGIGGEVVETFDSGEGGSFTKTFSIPADYHGNSRLAIRMDSTAGYYAYNWFWN
jgi:hypothetical protein